MPNYSGNACAHFSEEDRELLWWAARTLVDERGLLVRIISIIGEQVEWAAERAAAFAATIFGEGWQEKVRDIAEEALWRGHTLAALGLDPAGERAPWSWFNKILASVTGAAGGFFRMTGMAIDISVSTLIIMRSIAEIARAHGEDISSDEGKRACLEVMAFGGVGIEDDDAEVGYWSTRALFTHTTIEALVRQVATRFGVVLSEKALAYVVPAAGAVAGGGMNYVFMDFYQQMARVHFAIRKLERDYGDDGCVQACLEQRVRQARERRKSTR